MPSAPPVHKPKRGLFKKHGKDLERRRDQRRGSAWARGYDWTWQKLRAWKLRQDPLCAHCLAIGRIVPAEEVDHIERFEGKDDPRRLDPENLQSLCKPCHSRKTRREDAGGGATRGGGGGEGRGAFDLQTLPV